MHFQVAHRLSRRIRLAAPSLVRQTERGYLLEILLRKHAAIRDVRVVADIGSLTVHYDPAQLPEERLLAVVDAVIGNLASAPPPGANTDTPTWLPNGLISPPCTRYPCMP